MDVGEMPVTWPRYRCLWMPCGKGWIRGRGRWRSVRSS